MRSFMAIVSLLSCFGLMCRKQGSATRRRRAADRPETCVSGSGRLLVLDCWVAVRATDCDPAWLHRLRKLAHEIDLQKPVVERGRLHLHIVGEIEHVPERTRRDPLIEIFMVALRGLAAFH